MSTVFLAREAAEELATSLNATLTDVSETESGTGSLAKALKPAKRKNQKFKKSDDNDSDTEHGEEIMDVTRIKLERTKSKTFEADWGSGDGSTTHSGNDTKSDGSGRDTEEGSGSDISKSSGTFRVKHIKLVRSSLTRASKEESDIDSDESANERAKRREHPNQDKLGYANISAENNVMLGLIDNALKNFERRVIKKVDNSLGAFLGLLKKHGAIQEPTVEVEDDGDIAAKLEDKFRGKFNFPLVEVNELEEFFEYIQRDLDYRKKAVS